MQRLVDDLLLARADESDPAAPGLRVERLEGDGPGIPAAERARVFDDFVRLVESRARGAGGVGLGLAIVAEVAACSPDRPACLTTRTNRLSSPPRSGRTTDGGR
ncbi:ATP-binding protein [Streptomyces sp. NPDC093591]|uniref:ATP-binding protein n=1 Tax=Streptomyces sp. NPDC093591 TaxID=3366044 RepID=UPI003819578B